MPAAIDPAKKAEIVDGALVSLSAGQSLKAYCEANTVAYKTVWDWLNEDESASSAYARAKAAGTHYLADECIDISDDATGDLIVNEDGSERTNTEVVQRAKLRIDTRLRLIGKWNRKDYGEKVQLSDADGNKLDAPVIQYQLPENNR